MPVFTEFFSISSLVLLRLYVVASGYCPSIAWSLKFSFIFYDCFIISHEAQHQNLRL
jgi:hypothetical protein